MKLNERQIQYGFEYYFKEEDDKIRCITEVSEYNGETNLRINCTQLGDSFTPQFQSVKEKKRVLNEWCDFLKNSPNSFTELTFVSRMPQELFDAVCCQKNLKRLYIKWGVYKDLSKIENLQKLELLSIGSGAGVASILPISKLTNLIGLSVENFQKISDYSVLSKLKNLESLSILGDGMSPKYIKIDSLNFVEEMLQLRLFRLLTARLQSKDYTPLLKLKNLEHLSLGKSKEIMSLLYEQFLELPKLKWGFNNQS